MTTHAQAILNVGKSEQFRAPTGDLYVLDQTLVPFEVVRIFFISGPKGAIRGKHAHQQCSQFLAVVSGSVMVRIETPVRSKHEVLLETGDFLNLPPLHWASEEFLSEGTVLLVLCDLPYEESDYLREYEHFEAEVSSLSPQP